MNTTVTEAGTNMSGNKQRLIKAAVRDRLTRVFGQMDDESGSQLLGELQNFLSDIETSISKRSAKAPKLFSSASTYALGAVAGSKTKKCFTGKLWYYRDGDFDKWLPTDQPNTVVSTITVLTPMKDWTFREAAESVLDVVSGRHSLQQLGQLLVMRGHTITLPQLEAMVEATERGEKTGMVTNGYGNFAFVDNGDPDGETPVSVALVRRLGSHWYAHVVELARSDRWDADGRLMVCNLDTLKL